MNEANNPSNSANNLDPLNSLESSLSRGPIQNKMTEDEAGVSPGLGNVGPSPSRWTNWRQNMGGWFRRMRNR